MGLLSVRKADESCQETDILTGEPTLGHLDRIRNLRHELQAIRHVQSKQILTLYDIKDRLILTEADRQAYYASQSQDPHPRRLAFDELLSRTKAQSVLVDKLSDFLLYVLQPDVRAALTKKLRARYACADC